MAPLARLFFCYSIVHLYQNGKRPTEIVISSTRVLLFLESQLDHMPQKKKKTIQNASERFQPLLAPWWPRLPRQ